MWDKFRIAFDIIESSYIRTGEVTFRKNRLMIVSKVFLLHLSLVFATPKFSNFRNGFKNYQITKLPISHLQGDSVVSRKYNHEIYLESNKTYLNTIFTTVSYQPMLINFPELVFLSV